MQIVAWKRLWLRQYRWKKLWQRHIFFPDIRGVYDDWRQQFKRKAIKKWVRQMSQFALLAMALNYLAWHLKKSLGSENKATPGFTYLGSREVSKNRTKRISSNNARRFFAGEESSCFSFIRDPNVRGYCSASLLTESFSSILSSQMNWCILEFHPHFELHAYTAYEQWSI